MPDFTLWIAALCGIMIGAGLGIFIHAAFCKNADKEALDLSWLDGYNKAMKESQKLGGQE